MITREKKLTYVMAVQVREDSSLEWVYSMIEKAVRDIDQTISFQGMYLLKEEEIGEVIR